jgi:flagellar hook protein FlgE
MLRSLYSGISGMKNFQTKLDVIGNNIANVNTAGFKKSRVTFKDAMNQTISGASASTATRGGTNAMQVGLGSALATIDTITTGSSLQTTNRPLDLGIDGDGYFVVKEGNQQLYTRAGNFYLDDNGTLVNADGLKVQAFKYDTAGKLTNNYGDVNVNVNAVLPAKTTKNIAFTGNLAADAIDGTVFSQQIKTIDSTGNAQNSTVYFKKSAGNWALYFADPAATPAPIPINLTFDASGKMTTPNVTGQNIPIPTGKADDPTTPADESIQQLSVNLDLSNLTKVNGASTAQVNPDGNLEGKLDSFNVGASGEITGVYSNGLITTLGRIALAKFSNPSGLTKTGGNLFQETVNSGTPDVNVAGNGRGTIQSGSLEMSNVDLSEEFTDMIVAQRGFQANTKIITTSDDILQELINLKR